MTTHSTRVSRSRVSTFSWPTRCFREDPQPDDYADLLSALQIRGDFSTLIEVGSDTYVSGPQVERGLISSELAQRSAEGLLGLPDDHHGRRAHHRGREVRSDQRIWPCTSSIRRAIVWPN